MKSVGQKYKILGLVLALTLGACESISFPTGPATTTAKPTPAAYAKTKAPSDSELIGGSVEDLTSWFGTPTLRRKDLDAEVWQYSGSTCVALFFLYPGSDGVLKIDHVETRPRSAAFAEGPVMPPEQCFKQVAYEASH